MKPRKDGLGLSSKGPKGLRDKKQCFLQTTVLWDSLCMDHSKDNRVTHSIHQKLPRDLILTLLAQPPH